MALDSLNPDDQDELQMLQDSIRQRQLARQAQEPGDNTLRNVLIGAGSLGYGLGTGQSAPALAQSLYANANARDEAQRKMAALESDKELSALSSIAKQRAADKARREDLPLRFALEQEKQLAFAQAMGANQQQLQKMRAAADVARQELLGQQKLEQIKAEPPKALSTLGSVRRNQVISNAGASFDKDPILKQITTTNNSLDRATSLLNGSTPITGKNFALLQQDMINAMAPGGSATEGKVNRELVNTLASKLNDLQTQFGSIKDLRKEQPQIFSQLKSLINQVKADYNAAGQQRMTEIAANYNDVPDEAVQNTVNRKVKMLSDKFSKSPVESGASIQDRAKAILEQRKKVK